MKLTGILDRKKKKKIALGGSDEVQKRLESESEVMPDSLRPIDSSLPGCCPWDFPGKNTGVACHSLLQRIVPIQGSNPDLLHCREMLYRLSHQGSPEMRCK